MPSGRVPRAAGDYFERQTRSDLEKRGYVVVRSGGSRGAFDLVAMRHDRKPLLVQCKVSGRFSAADKARLLLAAQRAGATPILAQREKRGTVTYTRVTTMGRAEGGRNGTAERTAERITGQG